MFADRWQPVRLRGFFTEHRAKSPVLCAIGLSAQLSHSGLDSLFPASFTVYSPSLSRSSHRWSWRRTVMLGSSSMLSTSSGVRFVSPTWSGRREVQRESAANLSITWHRIVGVEIAVVGWPGGSFGSAGNRRQTGSCAPAENCNGRGRDQNHECDFHGQSLYPPGFKTSMQMLQSGHKKVTIWRHLRSWHGCLSGP